ncbi:multidrug effflux MFS transporter, partial [Solicola sp. PLA-1-18]|uniref:multidrug effflux MFS transporter n=1 Tax=Solicola sp. PLA-1-18 TaxID=3380532 RepID=UPI003B7AFAD1
MTPEPATSVDAPVADPVTSARPDAAVAPVGRRYVQLVLVLGAVIAIGPLSIDMYLPALPALADDLGASQAGAQVTLTAMLAGLALGQLVLGPVSDAYGRRRVMLSGLVLHVVMSVACALAPSLALLTTARVVQGLAGAALAVTAMAMVRDLFEGSAAARMLSRLVLVIGVAPVLAPTFGGLILGFTTWRGIFWVLGAAAAVLVLVAGLFLDESLPPSRRRPLHVRSTVSTYGSLLRDRTFVALVLTAGLMFAAIFAYVSGASFVLQDVYGLSERTFGFVFGANALVLVVFSQLNPVLLDRFTPLQILSWSTIAGVAAGVALVAVT